jgi:prepilin-type N-terminal cleavage/methylation domain-containing protein
MNSFTRSWKQGFTLAELLIALAILAVISTFVLPKILVAQQGQQNKAIFKETVATLSAVINTGITAGNLVDSNGNSQFGTYLFGKMNAVKQCLGDSVSLGCWDSVTQGTAPGGNVNQPGMILHNGAVIVGFDDCCTSPFNGQVPGEASNEFWLDVNGLAGPNQVDADQFLIWSCYGTVPCSVRMTGKSGQFIFSPAGQAMF